jgi:xylitol oxidase
MAERNWAGNRAYRAAELHHPASVDELSALVARHDRVKVLGTRHSFNGIADTAGALVSLARLPRVVELDRERRTVTVDGGITYGQLAAELDGAGWALHNTASLPHISVAGACATATHGSGDGNGNLATAVVAMALVTGGGDVVTLSRDADGERFRGAAVGLGALGVVTRLTLEVRPTYAVRQDVYENVPLAHLEERLDEVTACAYSASLFTDWRDATFSQVWLKRLVAEGASGEPAPPPFEGTRATGHRHPIAGLSPVNCTEQMGVGGAWHERLPHFRMDFTPSSGEELQTDYLVPRRHARAALRAVDSLRDRVAPLLLVSEVRTVAADDLWMSPCCGEACVSIHFTWRQDWPAVRALLPALEERLAPLDARPHWGKLFTMPPARVASLYPRLPEFRELARSLDPRGKFRNAFLDAYVFGEPTAPDADD